MWKFSNRYRAEDQFFDPASVKITVYQHRRNRRWLMSSTRGTRRIILAGGSMGTIRLARALADQMNRVADPGLFVQLGGLSVLKVVSSMLRRT